MLAICGIQGLHNHPRPLRPYTVEHPECASSSFSYTNVGVYERFLYELIKYFDVPTGLDEQLRPSAMDFDVSFNMPNGIISRLNVLLLHGPLEEVKNNAGMCRSLSHDSGNRCLTLLSYNLFRVTRHCKQMRV
jgi:hypothetical protein